MGRRRERKKRRREEGKREEKRVEKRERRGEEVRREAGVRGVPAGLTLLAVEDRQEAEHEGPAGGSEEAPPVIPDREVGRDDLDAEEDAWGQRWA